MKIVSLLILNVKLSYLIIFLLTEHDTEKTLLNRNPNKVQGHDTSSIRMLQMCDKSICKPLEIIYKSCLKSITIYKFCFKKEFFPSKLKIANIVPAHKKGNKQLLRPYFTI